MGFGIGTRNKIADSRDARFVRSGVKEGERGTNRFGNLFRSETASNRYRRVPLTSAVLASVLSLSFGFYSGKREKGNVCDVADAK